jgi:general secretion pathway protein A
MYNKFFGFKEKPFKLVPNPEYLFLSKSHEEALAHLTYAISQGEGFVEITGEVGTGKTTLCRVFLENLDKSIEAAYIFNPKLDALQLLKAINDELGIDSAPDNTKDLIDRLNVFLIKKKVAGHKVLVLVDEAQNLSLEVLEQLRLLSNLETTQEKLLQIILVGQPELGDMLSSHQLRQLGQRITINCRLLPLTYEETRDYISHRIALASHRAGPPFDKASYRAIYDYSGGIPRLINIACDRILLNAFSRNSFNITGPITREALSELTRKKAARPHNWLHAPAGLAILAAIFIPLIILLLYLANGQQTRSPASSTPPSGQAAQAEITPPVPEKKQVLEPSVQPTPSSTVSGEEPVAGAVEDSAPVQMVEPGNSGELPADIEPERRTAVTGPIPGEYPTADTLEDTPLPAAADSPAASPLPSEEELEQAAIVGQQQQNSMDAQNFQRYLQGLNSRLSRDDSLTEILKLWLPAAELNIKQSSTETDRHFFQEATKPYDMQVQPVATASDLTLLQTLNLPAIFTFYPPGHAWPKYLAVAAIDDEKVYFFTGERGQTASVDRDIFLRSWSGEAYIIWKNFKNLQGVIGQRSRGEDVRTLKSLLGQLGYAHVAMTDRYDKDTLQIIKDIQIKYGLQIDGLVGPFTKIALYNESPMFTKPSLVNFGAARTEKGN